MLNRTMRLFEVNRKCLSGGYCTKEIERSRECVNA